MSQVQPSAIRQLVALHLLLALAPLGMGVIPISYWTLPLAWCLESMPISQVMLLSIWVGMIKTRRLFLKLILAGSGATFLAFWLAWAQVLIAAWAPFEAFGPAFLNFVCVLLVLLAVTSLVLAGASRLIGMILIPQDSDTPPAEPQYRFSLFTLLAFATATAVLLGLVRISRVNTASFGTAATFMEFTLGAVVYSLNTLVAVWAALGPGHVGRRLGVVFLLSVVLGYCFAIGTYSSFSTEPWWLFVSFPLVIIVPTAIVALTLLYLRGLGFRLIPPQPDVSQDE